MKIILTLVAIFLAGNACLAEEASDPITIPGANENWHQAAGPHGNWRVNGQPPLHWSATRNENIVWRTPLPECGQSAVTIWNDRLFVTTHVPLKTVQDRFSASDIVGYCLDAKTGKILWTIQLPGTQSMEPAGGFTDATVFAPVTDGTHVWFFNRCGSMGCYDFTGREIWQRVYKMRFKHSNRQCEPILVGNVILNVEVLDKEAGSTMQKYKPGTSKTVSVTIPTTVDEKDVWTYIHGIDAKTGKVLWRESVGTSIHCTPVAGKLENGKAAIVHARGGAHRTIEKPYGISLTSLDPESAGKTLWSTALSTFDPVFSCHWDSKYVYAFAGGHHVLLSTKTGEVLKRQSLYESVDLWRYLPEKSDWVYQQNQIVKAGKVSHPNTNQANLVVGDWHYFLAHNMHYIGRVHRESGKVEYLEVPAQLVAAKDQRANDRRLWGKGMANRPTNANGLAIGRKGHNGTGWGHISAASPTLVGRYLFFPVVTGTVHVVDTQVEQFSPKALVSINDLGPAGETWTLSSLSFSRGRLYAHTMREILCIGRE